MGVLPVAAGSFAQTRAQATSDDFRRPELVPVTDLASAHQAIDTILEQAAAPWTY